MTHDPPSPARDEENRRLALWIESRPIIRPTHHGAKSPLGFWHGYNNGREFVWELAVPPDFRTDEAANALLLEAMLGMPEAAVHMMWRNGQFHLTLFLPGRPTMSGRDGGSDYVAKDRKAAIVKAALAYLEAQK